LKIRVIDVRGTKFGDDFLEALSQSVGLKNI